jgi:hypothetical protein
MGDLALGSAILMRGAVASLLCHHLMYGTNFDNLRP